MKRRCAYRWIVGCALLWGVSVARGQTMLKVNLGWGDAVRMGRWTPVFVAIADPQTRQVDLQIHGTYGEKSLAVWVHQTAVAQPRPTTYELLFPLNGQPARIEVIASDEKTGRTLAAQPLQNPASFLPAGRVPMRLLGPNEFLLGISGEIGDALRLQAQVNRAGLAGGVLDPIRLPANFIGYDGVSALVLVAADLAELKPEQEQAILQWVRRGGNLVFIPGTRAMPSNDDLVEALPCEIGVNRMVGGLNGRELSPRAGAAAVKVMDHIGYKRRWGLGYVLTLPMDIAPVQFAEANAANTLWRSMLAGMVRVPPTHEPTEMVLSDEQDILIGGPNAADSVGRGQRESVAIRHVLELLGATGSEPPVDWRGALMWMAGIFFLVGPVDSIILMQLGQTPRNWATIVGWVGLLASVGTYAAIRPADSPTIRRSLRLVDQVDDSMVAATDIIAVNSRRAKWARMKLDENEWWEPANQAARSFGPERFVDAVCREDRNGCRPEWIRLTGGEAQAWHGETAGTGAPLLRAKLSFSRDRAGNVHLAGKLVNASTNVMSDVQIETAEGNCRIGQLLGGGASMDVDAELGNQPIVMNGLPADVGDVAPERADRVEQLVKAGFACVYCRLGEDRERWEVVRAAVRVESHGG